MSRPQLATSLVVAVCCATFPGFSCRLPAQDPPDATHQDPRPSEPQGPENVAEAVAVDLAELRARLGELQGSDVAEAADTYTGLLADVQDSLLEAFGAPEGSDEQRTIATRQEERAALLERTLVVLEVLATKTGDDESLTERMLTARTQLATYGLQAPSEIDIAVDVDLDELRANTTVLAPAVLGDPLHGWLGLLERQLDAVASAKEAPEGSPERQKLEALSTDRDALIARAEILVDVLIKTETEDPSIVALVEDTRSKFAGLRAVESEQQLVTSTVPQDPRQAQELPIEVLAAQLRPLTKDQVEEELQEWLALLQRKALEIRSVEVASMTSEQDEEIVRYNERAVALRAEREALIRRVRTVIAAFEEKNGSIEDYEAYVDSLVAALTITGLRAAWIQFRAWLVNPEGGLAVAKNIGFFLAILVAFRVLAWFLAKVINRTMRAMRKSSDLLREFFTTTVRNVTMIIGLIVAVGQLGVDIGPLLAAVGAAGFVIAFALQGTLSNFASGVMLMIFRLYDVGDIIIAGGVNGKVGGMNLMSTTVRTFDNQIIVVPNNKIWGDVITNVTAASERRVDMVFGIGYGDDIASLHRPAHQPRIMLTLPGSRVSGSLPTSAPDL